MKLSGHIAVTAVCILAASAGVLVPLGKSITEADANVGLLKQTVGPEIPVQSEIEVLLGRIAEIEELAAERTVRLCEDTATATNAFESALAEQVRSAGLSRVNMESGPGAPIGKLDTFVINLGIEGTASQLHTLLAGIEAMPFVTRVLRLELMKGQAVRSVELTVAVLLETDR